MDWIARCGNWCASRRLDQQRVADRGPRQACPPVGSPGLARTVWPVPSVGSLAMRGVPLSTAAPVVPVPALAVDPGGQGRPEPPVGCDAVLFCCVCDALSEPPGTDGCSAAARAAGNRRRLRSAGIALRRDRGCRRRDRARIASRHSDRRSDRSARCRCSGRCRGPRRRRAGRTARRLRRTMFRRRSRNSIRRHFRRMNRFARIRNLRPRAAEPRTA